MTQKRVGDFLGKMVAPKVPPVAPQPVPTSEDGVGAAPIDVEKIKAAAGAKPDVVPQQSQVDPMLLKEIEVIQLKIRLAETEEQLLVQKVQEVRRMRAELLRIQRNLVAQAKGQIVVGPNGDPQAAPE